MLLPYMFHRLTLTVDASLSDRWAVASGAISVSGRHDFDSMVVLTLHSTWLEHNKRVFDKVVLLPSLVVAKIKVEFTLWKVVRLR